MIILPHLRIAIMTPPKCGTNTLHNVLCRHPWNGHTYVGPTPIDPNAIDRHVNRWPSEAIRFRKLVVVRHPLERLVSMYLHLTVRTGGLGLPLEGFAGYARARAAGEPIGRGLSEALYTWNLERWLAGVEYDNLLHVETLTEDLHAEDLPVERVPQENRSYKAKPYAAFYDNETLDVVGLSWARPDCNMLGYLWPEGATDATAAITT